MGAEAPHQESDDTGAQIGGVVFGHTRARLERSVRPDVRLAICCSCQLPKQTFARRTPFRRSNYPIQIRGALFFLPRLDFMHQALPARAATGSKCTRTKARTPC